MKSKLLLLSLMLVPHFASANCIEAVSTVLQSGSYASADGSCSVDIDVNSETASILVVLKDGGDGQIYSLNEASALTEIKSCDVSGEAIAISSSGRCDEPYCGRVHQQMNVEVRNQQPLAIQVKTGRFIKSSSTCENLRKL